MQRYVIWYVLACLWGALATFGFVRHRTANAALEAIFALLFLTIGLFIKRRGTLHRKTPKIDGHAGHRIYAQRR